MARSLIPERPDADALELERFLAGRDQVELEAASWFVREQDGLGEEDAHELQTWLATDPAHEAAYARLRKVWGVLGDLPLKPASFSAGPWWRPNEPVALGVPQSGASTAREGPRAVLDREAGGVGRLQPGRVPTRDSNRFFVRPSRRRLIESAFVGAGLFSMAAAGWLGWSLWQSQPVFTQTLATARGQQQKVGLPDGSTMWLDTASRVDVTLYRHRREVRLIEGQVQFAVKADAGRPFDVLTGPIRITVVGTRFSVRHTASGVDAGGVGVVVEEGKVRVSHRDRSESMHIEADGASSGEVLLTAGQAISAGPQGDLGPVETVAAAGADTAPWREGRLSFAGVPLTQVLAEFDRYGETGLVVRDPLVASLPMQGSFDVHRLDAFIRALPQVLPVRLRPLRDGRLEIVPAAASR